jgi:hypothetical protein
MGWEDSHLHQFIQGDTYYGAPDREYGMPMVSERRTRLGDVLGRPKDRLIYEYDFGDGLPRSSMPFAIQATRSMRTCCNGRADSSTPSISS